MQIQKTSILKARAIEAIISNPETLQRAIKRNKMNHYGELLKETFCSKTQSKNIIRIDKDESLLKGDIFDDFSNELLQYSHHNKKEKIKETKLIKLITKFVNKINEDEIQHLHGNTDDRTRLIGNIIKLAG